MRASKTRSKNNRNLGLIISYSNSINCRLPIIQGGTFSFFVPTFAILSLAEFKCPDTFDTKKNVWTNTTMTDEDKTEEWQKRMREIQGAICVSAIFQVIMGFSGKNVYCRKMK